MADAPFQHILDEMRARIQAELDGQIEEARLREAEAVTRAREEADAEADKRWAAKVDAVRAEWTARLDSEVAAARAEAEKRLLAESMRLRNEADQALAEERQRAAEAVEAERRHADEQSREALAAFDAERRQLEEQATWGQADLEPTSLLTATRAIDGARTLADALSALVRGAAALAPRAAVFLVAGGRFEPWSVSDVLPLLHQAIDFDRGGLLRAAVTKGARVTSSKEDPGRTVPLAGLHDHARAMAVPLLVGGQAVAVLYADDSVSADEQPAAGWAESVELLARHAAACLAQLTAARTLQALQSDGRAHPHAAAPDDEQSARRYAKLLVSEIKLYNEGAVRVGREKRDLLHRLRAEIERAQRLYEERVPPSVSGRGSFFQQELVNTLAGGDAALLGP